MVQDVKIDTRTTGSRHLFRQLTSAGSRWLIPIILVLASLGMSWTVTSFHDDEFSPNQEWTYLDYLEKLPDQGFIHPGEQLGAGQLNRIACDGIRDLGPVGTACDAVSDDLSSFPQQGINTAASYSPLYFATTLLPATAIAAVTGLDLLQSARYTGGLWLAGTMILFFGVFRSFRVPSAAILGLGMAYIGSPLAWWTYTYISTDAPTAAVALGALWAARRVIDGSTRSWVLVLISVLGVLFSVTNLLAVGLVVMYLLISAFTRVRTRRQNGAASWMPNGTEARLLKTAAASAVAALFAQAIWLAIRSTTAVGPSPGEGSPVALGAHEVGRLTVLTIRDTLMSTSTIAGSSENSYKIPGYLIDPLSWICIVGVIGGIIFLTSRSRDSALTIATAVACTMFVPILAVSLSQVQGAYFAVPAGYGAPLVASMLLSAGLLIKNPWAAYAIVAYGVVLVSYVISSASLLA